MNERPITNVAETVLQNQFTRRSLLRAGAALSAVSIIGCEVQGSQEGGNNQTGPSTTGTLAIATGSIAFSFNPPAETRLGDVMVNRLIYDSLYQLDPFPPRSELTPSLATDLPTQVDDTTYRITLRDDIEFHDGQPLTAEDVAFTIERYTNAEFGSFFSRFFQILSNVDVVDSHELEIGLSSPTTLLPYRLAAMRIISKSATTEAEEAPPPVGSGPYEVISAASQESASLGKSSKHRRADKFQLNELSLSVVPDTSGRLSGLYTGRFQLITAAPASSYQDLLKSDSIKTEAVPGRLTTYMLFNCSKPPFDDVRARQAVMYAIDRDAISAASFFDLADPVWEGEITTDDPDYSQPDTIYRHDPDHAKQLMSEAGHGDSPIPISLLVPSELEDLASQGPIIQENLREVGFEPEIIPGDSNAHYSRANEGDFHAFLLISDPSTFAADAEFRLRWLYYGIVPRQLAHLDDNTAAEIERILDEALTSPDEEGRKAALAEAQNMVQETIPMAPVHRQRTTRAWSDQVVGFRSNPDPGELYLEDVQV